jgi:hypothetical protein
MRKHLLGLIITSAFITLSHKTQAQNGLEKIVVEKFYVSNKADSIGSIGILPVGSVTYRIYVDMKPQYVFEGVYGNIPHPLKMSTTTAFFNNEDRGATNPNGISVINDRKNTVMLDSWLSVGAAANGQMGVLKTDDTTGSIGNANGILQNTDTSAGIPIKIRDGMVTCVPCAVTFVGFTSELDVFNNTSNYGNLFTTTNASWACLAGTHGPNLDTNRVLIAQITTNGVFSFQMNIQIGDSAGNAHDYVYSNPTGSEMLFTGLSYTSPIPANNAAVIENGLVPVTYALYPNPVTNMLAVILSSPTDDNDYQIRISDLLGQVVFEKKLSGIPGSYAEHLDVSALASGAYLFSIHTKEGFTSSRKLIKNQ